MEGRVSMEGRGLSMGLSLGASLGLGWADLPVIRSAARNPSLNLFRTSGGMSFTVPMVVRKRTGRGVGAACVGAAGVGLATGLGIRRNARGSGGIWSSRECILGWKRREGMVGDAEPELLLPLSLGCRRADGDA